MDSNKCQNKIKILYKMEVFHFAPLYCLISQNKLFRDQRTRHLGILNGIHLNFQVFPIISTFELLLSANN